METKKNKLTSNTLANVHMHSFVPPTMAGGYRLGKGSFSWLLKLEHKPKKFHIFCMKTFFGIVWEDG